MMRYDETYAVELHDYVDVEIDDCVHAGVVTKLFSRAGEVRVRYEDNFDPTREGHPRIKSARVPVRQISLIARDG